uniref:Reverse transcriptase Ty1/copia-type domain-containing protein n=1 Tax=Solanum lycopersicum TaxID=4081 RepID=A0A3Q7I3R6_SOLLC
MESISLNVNAGRGSQGGRASSCNESSVKQSREVPVIFDSSSTNNTDVLNNYASIESLKDGGVLISQRKFVLDLLKEYECSNYTSLSSPLDPNVKLRAKEGAPLYDPTYYRKLVGKLNFLTNTRMDIDFNVQQLSQFMQDPRLPHLQAAFHLLRYIKKDPTLGVYLSRNSDCTMRAYCDSDWATCPDSRRSVSGYLVLLGDSPISWRSKK